MNDLLDVLAEAALNGESAQAKVEFQDVDGKTKAVRVIVVAENIDDPVDVTDDFNAVNTPFGWYLNSVRDQFAEAGETDGLALLGLFKNELEMAFNYTGGLALDQWQEVYAKDLGQDFQNPQLLQLFAEFFKKGLTVQNN